MIQDMINSENSMNTTESTNTNITKMNTSNWVNHRQENTLQMPLTTTMRMKRKKKMSKKEPVLSTSH